MCIPSLYHHLGNSLGIAHWKNTETLDAQLEKKNTKDLKKYLTTPEDKMYSDMCFLK